MRRKRLMQWLVALLLVLCAGGLASAATMTLLHEFSGGTTDGQYAMGGVTRVGSILYGTTSDGGAYGRGTLFKVNTDGTGYQVIHNFAGGTNDGIQPRGDLLLDGSTLYGMTSGGGAGEKGVVYKIGLDGSGFGLVHSFAGGGADGDHPYGTLTLNGSTLYGTTVAGGGSNMGTVFGVNTDGTGFSLLHAFSGMPDDGYNPRGGLLYSDGTVYGMTLWGGSQNRGTAFAVDAAGGGCTVLHDFTSASNDGFWPTGGFVMAGSVLYGMTDYGGASVDGTVFKMDPDGTDFALLHAFTGGDDDGAYPAYSNLTLRGATLYGATNSGGDVNGGTIFSLNLDGTGYELLYDFVDNPNMGKHPLCTLAYGSSTLYGTTHYGGAGNMGTVFALDITPVPEPLSLVFFGTGVVGVVGFMARRRMRTSA